jgi:hypothetical protein
VRLFSQQVDTNRSFQFQKRRQLFIRTCDETLSVVAMRVNNPDRSAFAIHSRQTAPTPSGFAEIVSDGFPAPFHAADSAAFALASAISFSIIHTLSFPL